MQRRHFAMPCAAVVTAAMFAGTPALAAGENGGPRYPETPRSKTADAAAGERRDLVSTLADKAERSTEPTSRTTGTPESLLGSGSKAEPALSGPELAEATAGGLGGAQAGSGTLSASTAAGTYHYAYAPGSWSATYTSGRTNWSWAPAGDRAVSTVPGAGGWEDTVRDEDGANPVTYPGGAEAYRGLAWNSWGSAIVRKTAAPDGVDLVTQTTTPKVVAGQQLGPQFGPPALFPLGGSAIVREDLGDGNSDLTTFWHQDEFGDGAQVTELYPLGLDAFHPGHPALAQAPAAALGDMWATDPDAPTNLAFLGVDPADPTVGHLYVDHQENWPEITPVPVATFPAHPECDLPAPAFSTDRRTIAFVTAEGDPAAQGGVCSRTAISSVTVGSNGRFDAPDADVAVEVLGPLGAPYRTLSFTSDETPFVDGYRISGKNRYEVGMNTSAAFFDDQSADVVVVSGGGAYADALAGGPLAGEFNGPVFLTYSTALHGGVAAEIDRVLKPGGTVYITGGTASVSAAVEAALTKPGRTVTRLGGSNRYAVAVNIAKEMDRLRGGPPAAAFVAGGTAFADALVAGPAAVWEGGPILLSGDGVVPAVTQQYLDSVSGGAGFTTYGVGGAGSRSVASRADAVALTGKSRYDVARAVADEFFSGESISALADGRNWPDAVAGGAAMSRFGRPIMLVNGDVLPWQTAGRITLSASAVDLVLAFGGPASVPEAPLWQAADLAGYQTPLWGPDTGR